MINTFIEFLNEARGINLVCVDIQPTYESYIRFIPDFIDFLNENEFYKILYLYNGPDLGFEDSDEIKNWLMENGLDPEKLDNFKFYEKGYAFLRGWMDTGVPEEDIIKMGKYMLKNNIYDSRDIEEETYKEMGLEELSDNPDSIFIPDVIEEIKKLNKPLLCGGGKNECLLEVELLFRMINKRYKKHKKYIY